MASISLADLQGGSILEIIKHLETAEGLRTFQHNIGSEKITQARMRELYRALKRRAAHLIAQFKKGENENGRAAGGVAAARAAFSKGAKGEETELERKQRLMQKTAEVFTNARIKENDGLSENDLKRGLLIFASIIHRIPERADLATAEGVQFYAQGSQVLPAHYAKNLTLPIGKRMAVLKAAPAALESEDEDGGAEAGVGPRGRSPSPRTEEVAARPRSKSKSKNRPAEAAAPLALAPLSAAAYAARDAPPNSPATPAGFNLMAALARGDPVPPVVVPAAPLLPQRAASPLAAVPAALPPLPAPRAREDVEEILRRAEEVLAAARRAPAQPRFNQTSILAPMPAVGTKPSKGRKGVKNLPVFDRHVFGAAPAAGAAGVLPARVPMVVPAAAMNPLAFTLANVNYTRRNRNAQRAAPHREPVTGVPTVKELERLVEKAKEDLRAKKRGSCKKGGCVAGSAVLLASALAALYAGSAAAPRSAPVLIPPVYPTAGPVALIPGVNYTGTETYTGYSTGVNYSRPGIATLKRPVGKATNKAPMGSAVVLTGNEATGRPAGRNAAIPKWLQRQVKTAKKQAAERGLVLVGDGTVQQFTPNPNVLAGLAVAEAPLNEEQLDAVLPPQMAQDGQVFTISGRMYYRRVWKSTRLLSNLTFGRFGGSDTISVNIPITPDLTLGELQDAVALAFRSKFPLKGWFKDTLSSITGSKTVTINGKEITVTDANKNKKVIDEIGGADMAAYFYADLPPQINVAGRRALKNARRAQAQARRATQKVQFKQAKGKHQGKR